MVRELRTRCTSRIANELHHGFVQFGLFPQQNQIDFLFFKVLATSRTRREIYGRRFRWEPCASSAPPTAAFRDKLKRAADWLSPPFNSFNPTLPEDKSRLICSRQFRSSTSSPIRLIRSSSLLASTRMVEAAAVFGCEISFCLFNAFANFYLRGQAFLHQHLANLRGSAEADCSARTASSVSAEMDLLLHQ